MLSAWYRRLDIEMAATDDKSKNLISSDAVSKVAPPTGKGRNHGVKKIPLTVAVIYIIYGTVLRITWPQQLYLLLNIIGPSIPFDAVTSVDGKL